MNEYLLIIRGGEGIENLSPEQMQAHMQDWQNWMQGLAEKGHFASGEPLMDEARTLINKGTKVLDRPLAEGKELVGGYLIFKAESLDEAAELAKGCPGFQHDCSIEVRGISKIG